MAVDSTGTPVKLTTFRLAVIGVTLWISGFMCGVFGSSDTASDWLVFLKTVIYQ